MVMDLALLVAAAIFFMSGYKAEQAVLWFCIFYVLGCALG